MHSIRLIGFAAVLAVTGAACQLEEPEDQPSGTAQRPIIGGEPDVADHPSACELVIKPPPDMMNPNLPRDDIRCSCALIDPQTLITAAACVWENLDRDTLDDIAVRFVSAAGEALTPSVTEGVVHRYFDDKNPSAFNLALLRLDEAPAGIEPAVLNERPLTQEDLGTPVTLVGFGNTTDETPNTSRRQVETPITLVDPRFILAGTETATTCKGDTGGPVFLEEDGEEVLVAVTGIQTRCFAGVQRTRVDVHLTTFIYPYLDRFAGPCPKDGVCDEQVECRSVDPDCEPCAFDGETCEEDCPTRDWDCPIGSFVGEGCTADGQCEEGGRCIAAADDAAFTYCSRPCDPAGSGVQCPQRMSCLEAEGALAAECTYDSPSPGSQGFPCTANSQCRSGICEESICVVECDLGGAACPEPYECGPSSVQPGTDVCLGDILSGGGGFCAAGTPGQGRGSLLGLLIIALAGLWSVSRSPRRSRS